MQAARLMRCDMGINLGMSGDFKHYTSHEKEDKDAYIKWKEYIQYVNKRKDDRETIILKASRKKPLRKTKVTKFHFFSPFRYIISRL